MTKVSSQEASLILMEEGRISRQLLNEFGLRLEEKQSNLLSRAVAKFSNQTLTTDESHAILCAMISLEVLKNEWQSEVARGDASAKKGYK